MKNVRNTEGILVESPKRRKLYGADDTKDKGYERRE
jgi:hypothetical protein